MLKKPVSMFFVLALVLTLSLTFLGCGGGGGGAVGPAGPAGPTGATGSSGSSGSGSGVPVLYETQDLPGIDFNLIAVTGSSSPFQVGDSISITFTLARGDGGSLKLSEIDSFRVWVSGPTSNYQRVIGANNITDDVAVKNADGSYTYTIPDPIPAVYMEPYYDTTRFSEGELTGQALQSGTYTIAIRGYKYYEINGENVRDVFNATKNILFGTAVTLEDREVVTKENCNQCHVTVQMHGGSYRDPKLCVTCHTAGAEDSNSVNDDTDNTPQTIEFKVLIHKLHNGAHLPSVLGVATYPDGTRDYGATPVLYQVGGRTAHDFYKVKFPRWPNMGYPMPRDTGYDALTSDQKAQEDAIRKGVTDCNVCHGDDGGAVVAPAQGDVYKTKPSRRVCGSCHDDINWSQLYTSNNQTMPVQANDDNCALCHTASGTSLSVQTAHLHPSNDSVLNPGMNAAVTLTPSDGVTLDPGEKMQVALSITDDAGVNVDPSTLYRMTVLISGPNNNRQLFQRMYFPFQSLGATADSYTFNIPGLWPLDFIGDATGAAQTLTGSRTPFWDSADTEVHVFERTASGAADTLKVASIKGTNYIIVVSTGTFSQNDYVVIDDGGANEEYYKIYAVTTNSSGDTLLSLGRINTSTTSSSSYQFQPTVRVNHSAGTAIRIVTLTEKIVTTDYTLTKANGEVHLVAGRFTAGNAVLVSSVTDWIMPDVYPHGYNRDNVDNQSWGEWAGLAVQDGTYNVGFFPRKRFYIVPPRTLGASGATDDTQYYSSAVRAQGGDFLVGAATEIKAYDLISSADTCNSCHGEVWTHGRRGADTCLTCHGTVGFGSSGGTTANFRVLLHKIHRGSDLANASTFAGGDFAEIVFPAFPDGVKQCDKCHGTSDAWKSPADRSHVSQVVPTQTWRAACTSCHDSDAVAAHVELQTFTGQESCAICHGAGTDFAVETKHKVR